MIKLQNAARNSNILHVHKSTLTHAALTAALIVCTVYEERDQNDHGKSEKRHM